MATVNSFAKTQARRWRFFIWGEGGCLPRMQRQGTIVAMSGPQKGAARRPALLWVRVWLGRGSGGDVHLDEIRLVVAQGQGAAHDSERDRVV